ncbi:XRN 5'-3' exonuclease N-terminus-domain-containing protein [Lipomyces oligophaga]|uniref:XRN 5'-3' exonuclease N-terminus-domain-containing protein n=1 Tax=Lipomyces oligophaga TaxID=45792 RepID=UPI0034CF5D6E
MGVPALFRWLSRKYPRIVTSVIEEPDREIDGITYPADFSRPNPNEELDNLYLDMNGIVHPCSHPENRPPPGSEDEMMLEVFRYTDRVVSMARPRKVLMIAVDGVAPRAKMNQQRSRRFRSAKEAKEKDDAKARMVAEMEAMGKIIDDSVKDKRSWDTNVITPGTPFMDKLAKAIRYWVVYKLNTEPGWRDLEVIISDAAVPGEGEHKIMEFIRSQRQSPYYDPNTSHAIYGLDADLIMLGLATHEPHFRVLREDVFFQDRSGPRVCHMCGQPGHQAAQCTGERKIKNGEFDELGSKPIKPEKKPFIWLHVGILREYLDQELFIHNLPFKFDLERAIDDWVFLCFFVGNDFLPHIPSLEIRENGIDKLVNIWRRTLPQGHDYLTLDGTVNIPGMETLLRELGHQEPFIFQKRQEFELRRNGGQPPNRQRQNDEKDSITHSKGANGRRQIVNPRTNEPIVNRYKADIGPTSAPSDIPLVSLADAKKPTFNANVANRSAASYLKAQMLARKKSTVTDAITATSVSAESVTSEETDHTTATEVTKNTETDSTDDVPITSIKRKAEEEAIETGRQTSIPTAAESGDAQATEVKRLKTQDESEPTSASIPVDSSESEDENTDSVRLWEQGYRDRYYTQKFKARTMEERESIRRAVVRSYIEGVCWVLLYYYQGCPSWTWFYPYHYAPFAGDFTDIRDTVITFEKGKPFRPYEQLMGVMPSASAHVLPPLLRPLMTDKESDISDFYPTDFPIDMNGKKMAWQGVALLPFIDELRLLTAINEKYPMLSADEHARNGFGHEAVFVSGHSHVGAEILRLVYSSTSSEENRYSILNPLLSRGLIGAVKRDPSYLPANPRVAFPLNDTDPDTFVSSTLATESVKYSSIEDNTALSAYYAIPIPRVKNKSMLLPGCQPKLTS